ncbi:hypothetical protein CPT_Moonbeam163 [Bacillus phage Moonbeam]|uniref:Uncharacterized protein n=1 Tax=Bacillus phage Moonbeam TaxID=1540091 RepID=A0A0A0RSQ1_9CAUD|nr:hypothetical protein CPT_Moonbeam163 [Bacillus phage Moonbeam]AIW03561.1 hypothetical protein CPT_Moonbeam163 [Bacillus phage Moonbeam]
MGEPIVRGIGKFIVLKNGDLDRYLDDELEWDLYNIVQTIAAGRSIEGKVEDNHYIVVNKDEPYIDEVIAVLKKHGHWG